MGGAGISVEIWRRFSKLKIIACVGTEALGNMAGFGKTARNPRVGVDQGSLLFSQSRPCSLMDGAEL